MTKNIAIIVINLVTPKAQAKNEHLFNEPAELDLRWVFNVSLRFTMSMGTLESKHRHLYINRRRIGSRPHLKARQSDGYVPSKSNNILLRGCFNPRVFLSIGRITIPTLQYKKTQSSIGLDHPLDVVSNPKYNLLHFITTIFLQREEGTSF